MNDGDRPSTRADLTELAPDTHMVEDKTGFWGNRNMVTRGHGGLAAWIVAGRRLMGLCLMICVFVLGVGGAGPVAAANAPIVHTILGNIDVSRYPNGATFDRETLLALGTETLETETHFTKGLQQFEGVRLRKVLEAVGARGTSLTTTALDGYSVKIPFEDVERFQVFLALKWNGVVMRPRNKGPIWIIYPITKFPEVNTEIFSARSTWQLKTLTIK